MTTFTAGGRREQPVRRGCTIVTGPAGLSVDVADIGLYSAGYSLCVGVVVVRMRVVVRVPVVGGVVRVQLVGVKTLRGGPIHLQRAQARVSMLRSGPGGARAMQVAVEVDANTGERRRRGGCTESGGEEGDVRWEVGGMEDGGGGEWMGGWVIV